jgi:hypothetical protein
LETQIGKLTLNGCSVFISTISGYNATHGSICIIFSLAKKTFESGSTIRNREIWGKGKNNRPDISFSIPKSFLSYFHFLFYLILVFHLSYLIYFLTFAFSFIFHLAFINFQTTLGESYNIQVHIHFGSIGIRKKIFSTL